MIIDQEQVYIGIEVFLAGVNIEIKGERQKDASKFNVEFNSIWRKDEYCV
jgi:hypothetical protein